LRDVELEGGEARLSGLQALDCSLNTFFTRVYHLKSGV